MNLSVVIPLYNKAPYIERALKSVLSQSFRDFEVVVVDDGSTDGGDKVVEGMGEERIRLIHQENAGVSAARNTAIKSANGEWVAFLDADDEWFSNKLELQVNAIRTRPDVVWASGGYISVRGEKILAYQKNFESEWFEDDITIRDVLVPLASGHRLWIGTVMIKRRVLLEVGGFDPSLHIGEELDLWLRVAVKYPQIIYVTGPIAKYYTGIEGSLVSEAVRKADVAFSCMAIRRVISMMGQFDAERAKLVAQLSQRLILDSGKAMLGLGNNRFSRELFNNFSWLRLGVKGMFLKIMCFVPSVILKIFYIMLCHLRKLYTSRGK